MYFENRFVHCEIAKSIKREHVRIVEIFRIQSNSRIRQILCVSEFSRTSCLKSRRETNEFAIYRIYFISSLQSERFYLRLLLTIVANLTSYEHFRTIDDVMHSTFQIACVALNMIDDDRE